MILFEEKKKKEEEKHAFIKSCQTVLAVLANDCYAAL